MRNTSSPREDSVTVLKRMNSKKGKSPSLQFKIGRYLLIFSAFVIAVIAIFQLVLLEPMYEQSKTDEVIDVAERISDELNSAYLNEHIYQVQQQTDTCVMVYLADTASWRFEASDNQGCLLYRLTPSSLGSLIAGAGRSADGTYMVKEKAENIYPEKQNRDFLHIIYTKIVNRNGRDAIVMVSAGVSPISSTLATLRKQLILIAVLILLAVGVLTMTMYREIARPLNRITASAKTLPSGSFALDPATSRYAEAEELNSTLSPFALATLRAGITWC